MKLRLWKIKCAGWPRLLLGEPRWEGGRGKERERDEQSLLLPARCCRVLQVLRQSCCSLPSSPGSLFLWFLVSSQKRKISGRWKILATNPICHRQRPVPQGRQRTMCVSSPSHPWRMTQMTSKAETPEEEGCCCCCCCCLLWFCFLFNNMPFPSPHHISIRLFCRTRSPPELVWRLRGANEHLGHSCTPNQAFATFHWPEVDQASPYIQHLPLLHR